MGETFISMNILTEFDFCTANENKNERRNYAAECKKSHNIYFIIQIH